MSAELGDEEAAIQALKQEASETVDQSLAATRRMKQMAYEAEEVGNQTINNLYDQGEQLNRIENGLDKVNNNLGEAEDEMREMEKTCGCCTCPWDKRKEFSGNESKQFRKTAGDSRRIPGSSEPIKSQPGASTNSDMKMKRVLEDDAREDEMDENLDAVGNVLNSLKNQANEMNRELNAQNSQLDRIDDKMDSNINRTEAANQRAQRLL